MAIESTKQRESTSSARFFSASVFSRGGGRGLGVAAGVSAKLASGSFWGRLAPLEFKLLLHRCVLTIGSSGSSMKGSLRSEIISTTSRMRSFSPVVSFLRTSRQNPTKVSGSVSFDAISPIRTGKRAKSMGARASYSRTRGNITRLPISSL